jgi:uncharacterized protein (TIGR02466 family)
MDKLQILPTTLYKFTVPSKLYKKICELTEEINFETVTTRAGQPYFGKSKICFNASVGDKKWNSIVNYTNNKLEEVCKDLNYLKYFESLKNCLMWVNRSGNNQWHHPHKHKWSLLSGIIYVKGSSGSTYFIRESEYALDATFDFDDSYKQNNQIIYTHKPENGTMLIFPSTLKHSVSENTSETPRVTISFNSFFDGQLGSRDALSFVDVKLK